MRTLRVGVVTPDLPLSTECARHLTSWAPPLPSSCQVIGLLPQIFSMIAQYTGLNYTLVPLYGTNYGSLKVTNNGSFDGHLGMLQRGRIDILVGSLKWKVSRDRYFDYLRPILRSKASLLVNAEEEISFYRNATAIVNQIDIKLWIGFIIILICLRRLAAIAENHSPTAIRSVAISQILLLLHFVNIYKGTLLSAYLIGPADPFNDILEISVSRIERNEMRLVVANPGLIIEMLKTSPHPQLQRLYAALSYNPPVYYYHNRTHATQLLNDHQAVYLALGDSSFYEALEQNCNLRVIGLNFPTQYDTYSSMIVQKELANVTEMMNHAMDELSMPSLIPVMMKSYYRGIEYKQQVCAAVDHEQRHGWGGVTLTNLSGPILMIVAIGLISCGVIIVEIFVLYIGRFESD